MRRWMLIVCGALVLGAGWLLSGCDVGSPNEVVAGVGNNFSGYYVNPSGGHLVTHNSGSPIDSLSVQQDGNQIQAVDNNNQLFSGTIAENGQSNNVSFNMTGPTTAGAIGTMNGTLSQSGTAGTMSGIWAEPSMYGSIYGTATVPAAPTNSLPSTNTNTTVNAIIQFERTIQPRLWFERDQLKAGLEYAQALPRDSRRRPC